MKYKRIHIKWCQLAILFLLLSCKSTDPVPSPQEEEVIEYEISEFAELIQTKTGLVKDITANVVEELAPGLSYAKIEYKNADDRPMVLYILHANLREGVSLVASAATNGDNLNAKETVRKQVSYVADRGYNVLAAVNGDFWRVNADEQDNTPMGQAYGPIVIDGEVIKEITRSTQYYFGASLKDGSFLMGNKVALLRAQSNIKEAIGGRYLLVNEGKDVSGQISNRDIAPRTSIGDLDAYNIVFVVVDGRRSEFSQGVTMQDLGKIYKAIGVNTAINLDGGGSSTLILKRQAELVLENMPSDNVERSVTNSWVIVEK